MSRVTLDFGIPIANAVLTTENDAQAEARMVVKGKEAAKVAVEMANLVGMLDSLKDEG
ncbi:6,7-dimethyl-8-ribityllumazine synthase [Acinetobacter baumannii]